MKHRLHLYTSLLRFRKAGTHLAIQAPLPDFLHTLPKLLTIPGQGTGWQGPAPLAPPEEPANDT